MVRALDDAFIAGQKMYPPVRTDSGGFFPANWEIVGDEQPGDQGETEVRLGNLAPSYRLFDTLSVWHGAGDNNASGSWEPWLNINLEDGLGKRWIQLGEAIDFALELPNGRNRFYFWQLPREHRSSWFTFADGLDFRMVCRAAPTTNFSVIIGVILSFYGR